MWMQDLMLFLSNKGTQIQNVDKTVLVAIVVCIFASLYFFFVFQKERRRPLQTTRNMSNVSHPLIEKCLLRQGRCRILDLGSGWVDGHGFFQATEAYRANGCDVTLTAVDVIFPPLLRPDAWTNISHNNPAELARLRDLQTNHGIECVGQDLVAFVRQAARDYSTNHFPGDGQSSPKRFDIIHMHYVYNDPPAYLDIGTLLNPGGFWIENRLVGIPKRERFDLLETDYVIRSLKKAETIAKSMGCRKACVIRQSDVLVVQKVPFAMNGFSDVNLADDYTNFD